MVIFYVIRRGDDVISQYAIKNKTVDEIKDGLVLTVAPVQISEKVIDAYAGEDEYIVIKTAQDNAYFYNPTTGLFKTNVVMAPTDEPPAESVQVTESEFLNMLEEAF